MITVSEFFGGVPWWMTQPFGQTDHARGNPDYHYGQKFCLPLDTHPGIDVGAAPGTPLFCPVVGEVIIAGGPHPFKHTLQPNPNAAHTGQLKILTDSDDEVIIGHMQWIDVAVGDRVTLRQPIGRMGYDNGWHAHVEIRLPNHPECPGGRKIVDPMGTVLGEPPAGNWVGNWVGTYGEQGFCLAGWDGSADYSYFPRTVLKGLDLLQGWRWSWGPTTDGRALHDPDKAVRRATTFADDNQVVVRMQFADSYSGDLHLYMLDWDRLGRRQAVVVDDGRGPQERVVGPFDEGAWLTFPIAVPSGGTLTVTVNRLEGPHALLSGMFLGNAGNPPLPDRAPSGNWVGTYGTHGYCLGGWDGAAEYSYFPRTVLNELALERGWGWSWGPTTDERGLHRPDKADRRAAAFADDTQIVVRMHFADAYSGTLHLYVLDWDRRGRRQAVTVDDGRGPLVERLTLPFDEGMWLHFPIRVEADGTVTITVDKLNGPHALLSGVFLGDSGVPPLPDRAPQGDWVGAYGSGGFCLAGRDGVDHAYFPSAVVVACNLEIGWRWSWGSSIDVRALQDPYLQGGVAGTFADDSRVQVNMFFADDYSGTLHLYVLDWDRRGRRQIVAVEDEKGRQVERLTLPFDEGMWLHFPITVRGRGSVLLSAEKLHGPHALVSGVFLGDAGPPPLPDRAPQGDWVGVYGSDGFCLAGWEGAGDSSSFPDGSLALEQGWRWSWGQTTDPRALESADERVRRATAFADDSQVVVHLRFGDAYSGILHLYMLDWDRRNRRQVVIVDDDATGNRQQQMVTLPFEEGVWLHFPVSTPAGGTITITVAKLNGPHALLSGIFLDRSGRTFKDFRPWHGQLGPTAGFAHADRLWLINQDKYWVWRPLSGWLVNGFLGELWQDAPTVRADAPPHVPPIGDQFEPSVPLLDKRPYDYPGVSAAYVPGWDTASRPYVVLIQHSRYWEKYLDAPDWRFSGRLADMFFDAREVDGILPWTHTGVTAAYSRHSAVVLIQRDRYWQFDDGGERVDEGWLRDRWPTAPTVDGMRPWEGRGVRGMCMYRSFLGISSNDRFWLLDLASDLWIAHGHLSDIWKLAPGIDVSLTHPIPADEAHITLRMGEDDWWLQPDGRKEGHGHLGEDVAPKDCSRGPGQTIRSVAAGKVVSVPSDCGNYYHPMAIEHLVHDIPEADGPIYSFYGHVEALTGINEGDWVKAGTPIAQLPDPCRFGFAAHVHLEIKNSHAHLYGPLARCQDPQTGRLVSMGYATNVIGDDGSDFQEPDAGWRDLGNCQKELAPGARCRFYVPTRFISDRGGGPRSAFGPPCKCPAQALTSDAADGAVRRHPICPAGIETGLPIVPGPGPDPTREH